MEKKLIEYIRDFKLIDLLGFANILGVEEEENFEEFCSNIVLAFTKQRRKMRKELLKLAKDISTENKREAADLINCSDEVMSDGV